MKYFVTFGLCFGLSLPFLVHQGKKNPTELPVHHCDSIIETSVRENLEMMSGDQLSPLCGPDPNHTNVLKSVPEVNIAGGGWGA